MQTNNLLINIFLKHAANNSIDLMQKYLQIEWKYLCICCQKFWWILGETHEILWNEFYIELLFPKVNDTCFKQSLSFFNIFVRKQETFNRNGKLKLRMNFIILGNVLLIVLLNTKTVYDANFHNILSIWNETLWFSFLFSLLESLSKSF